MLDATSTNDALGSELKSHDKDKLTITPNDKSLKMCVSPTSV